MTTVTEFRCMLCSSPLTSEQYQNTLTQLEQKLVQKYNAEIQKEKLNSQSELNKKDELIQNLRTMLNDLKVSYGSQGDALRKNYEALCKQNQDQFDILSKELKANHDKDLAEKDRLIEHYRNQESELKQMALQEARTQAQIEIDELKQHIHERDLLVTRARNEVESLKKRLSEKQSELKGDAGEIELSLQLTSSFPKDRFERTNRGNSKGDLVQHIRTEEGKDIDSRIVYDNKEAESISPSDIAKAISYKKIHRTVYSIIVSKNLPKTEVKNGLLGEKDGILLVHPSIAVQVATQLRDALINVAKVACSSLDKQSKETILYQYAMSTDFANNMEELYYVQKKLMELQNTEEKNHHLIWKKKKDQLGKLLDLCNRLSGDIRSILEREGNKGQDGS